eukprot:1161858-Pelagomonas_calceolata.AAC.2
MHATQAAGTSQPDVLQEAGHVLQQACLFLLPCACAPSALGLCCLLVFPLPWACAPSALGLRSLCLVLALPLPCAHNRSSSARGLFGLTQSFLLSFLLFIITTLHRPLLRTGDCRRGTRHAAAG